PERGATRPAAEPVPRSERLLPPTRVGAEAHHLPSRVQDVERHPSRVLSGGGLPVDARHHPPLLALRAVLCRPGRPGSDRTRARATAGALRDRAGEVPVSPPTVNPGVISPTSGWRARRPAVYSSAFARTPTALTAPDRAAASPSRSTTPPVEPGGGACTRRSGGRARGRPWKRAPVVATTPRGGSDDRARLQWA